MVAEVDVVVAGGGPAGLRRRSFGGANGASAIVIEQYGYLGGLCTQGMVHHWPMTAGTDTRICAACPRRHLTCWQARCCGRPQVELVVQRRRAEVCDEPRRG